MDIKFKKMDPVRVAFVRHVGSYSECGTAWNKLLPTLGKLRANAPRWTL